MDQERPGKLTDQRVFGECAWDGIGWGVEAGLVVGSHVAR